MLADMCDEDEVTTGVDGMWTYVVTCVVARLSTLFEQPKNRTNDDIAGNET